MSQFGLVITDAGLALQNLIQTGDTLTFTRVAVGDGELPEGGTKGERTALVSEKDSVSPAYATLVNGMATVEAQFSNDGLGVAYTIREVGLFAQDPDDAEAEILYAYGNAGDNGDYMPAGEGADIITLVEKLVVAVGNASSVTAVLDESAAYVTQQQWESHVGVGGLTQHPAVTGSTSGFMTPAMKEKLDNLVVRPYWSIEFGSACGMITAPKGGFVFTGEGDSPGWTYTFTMAVKNVSASNISLTLLPAHVYDGLSYKLDGNAASAAMSIPPGSHSIQLLLSSDGMGGMGMALADFLTDDLIFDQANAYYG